MIEWQVQLAISIGVFHKPLVHYVENIIATFIAPFRLIANYRRFYRWDLRPPYQVARDILRNE